MDIELYSEYRFAGRNTASAVIIPLSINDNQVKVIYKSVSAKIEHKSEHKIKKLINSDLVTDDVNRSLVKQDEIDPQVCHKIEQELEKNGGSLDRDVFSRIVEKAESEINDQD